MADNNIYLYQNVIPKNLYLSHHRSYISFLCGD